MSKKFKIKQNPTFKAKVEIPVVGVDKGVDVTFEFKYMGRKDLAEMYDKWHERAKEMEGTLTDGESSLSDITSLEIDFQVSQIKDIVVGWDIEDEFNEENIEGLVNISVNIVSAITKVYQKSYTEVKLGN